MMGGFKTLRKQVLSSTIALGLAFSMASTAQAGFTPDHQKHHRCGVIGAALFLAAAGFGVGFWGWRDWKHSEDGTPYDCGESCPKGTHNGTLVSYKECRVCDLCNQPASVSSSPSFSQECCRWDRCENTQVGCLQDNVNATTNGVQTIVPPVRHTCTKTDRRGFAAGLTGSVAVGTAFGAIVGAAIAGHKHSDDSSSSVDMEFGPDASKGGSGSGVPSQDLPDDSGSTVASSSLSSPGVSGATSGEDISEDALSEYDDE
jgi:hypothetical protein